MHSVVQDSHKAAEQAAGAYARARQAYAGGDAEQAVSLLRDAVRLQPRNARFHADLGGVLHACRQNDAALAHLQAAAQLQPDADIMGNLGSVLASLARPAEAASCYRQGLALAPHSAALHFNLANVLMALNQNAAAEAGYREALALQPDLTAARYNLGRLLLLAGRLEDAVAQLRQVADTDPGHVAAWQNLGVAFQQQNQLPQAIACYEEARQHAPHDAELHYNLGCALLVLNRTDDAAACYETALRLDPNHTAARFGLCRAQLPIIYRTEAEIEQRRHAYTGALIRLARETMARPPEAMLQNPLGGVGASPPFFLAYGGQNDRDLQQLYGLMTADLFAAVQPVPSVAPPPHTGERIRVGIVSGFFHRHTVWSLMIEGWLAQLDRSQFEVLGYHTGMRQDDRTAWAAERCYRFRHGLGAEAAWRRAIQDDAPHVLIYPEIGMDPVAAQLAAQRLAGVQCVCWGHPTTTGLPTIDHYLSSDAMELPGNEAHYTENLVPLPNLGIWCEPGPAPRPGVTRAELGLREDATVYWSGQSLYKYLPQHDAVFPRIARQVPNAQFVFIAYERGGDVTEIFCTRLHRAFAAHGLDADRHCVILPCLPQDLFVAAVGLCDAVLDTIGWSGGRSTLEALATNPPVVALPGPLMRSRHSAAMLKIMELPELIAADTDEYVAIAARLAQDPAWAAGLRRRVAENKPRLYRDAAAIRGLESFLHTAVRKG